MSLIPVQSPSPTPISSPNAAQTSTTKILIFYLCLFFVNAILTNSCTKEIFEHCLYSGNSLENNATRGSWILFFFVVENYFFEKILKIESLLKLHLYSADERKSGAAGNFLVGLQKGADVIIQTVQAIVPEQLQMYFNYQSICYSMKLFEKNIYLAVFLCLLRGQVK